MIWNNSNAEANEGDLVELVGVGYKHIIITIAERWRPAYP